MVGCGALDVETGGFDDVLQEPCEASFAAPVRDTLPGRRVNGSEGVLDVGTGGFDAHDDGILEAPCEDLMRLCGDDCEAIGVGEFGKVRMIAMCRNQLWFMRLESCCRLKTRPQHEYQPILSTPSYRIARC